MAISRSRATGASALVLACLAITACDPDGGAHSNNAVVSATCEVQRQHRRVSSSPVRYEGSTVDVHGAGTTCHSELAAYGARVSGTSGGNTYWTSWPGPTRLRRRSVE